MLCTCECSFFWRHDRVFSVATTDTATAVVNAPPHTPVTLGLVAAESVDEVIAEGYVVVLFADAVGRC